jgi:predicted transcriptional regulator
METETLIGLTAEIVATHLANNQVPVRDMSNLITKVYNALVGLESPTAPPEPERRATAAAIRASVKTAYLTCLECGRRQKTLKKHLTVAHELRPQGYRERFGLPPNYPMMAPEYTARRKEMARAMWRGRKPAPKAIPEARLMPRREKDD